MSGGDTHFEWTTREVRILTETYPTGGAKECYALLSNRSVNAIYGKAREMKIKRIGYVSRPNPYETSELMDRRIAALYSVKQPTNGELQDLCERIGRHRGWVADRARKMGLIKPRQAPRKWTPDEDELLEMHAGKHEKVIAKHFRAAGYNRSATAITVRIRTKKIDHVDPDHFSARELARFFGVDSNRVTRLIASGLLKAKRRGTDRTEAQGGDHWWIARKDIREFMIRAPGEWDHRRCDQLFLVEILAGRVGVTETEAAA